MLTYFRGLTPQGGVPGRASRLRCKTLPYHLLSKLTEGLQMTRCVRKLACLWGIFLLIFTTSIASGQKRFVTTRGKEIVAPDGKPLLLKGINLGNWLWPEGYMFKFKSTNSPRVIQAAINELVGEDEARQFWKTYRDNYITREDIHFIKQSGFNSVRVPFSYRLFVSDGTTARLEGPGYELLDRVVDWCRREGLYVILDMHAAPGGQTGANIDDSFGYPFLFETP